MRAILATPEPCPISEASPHTPQALRRYSTFPAASAHGAERHAPTFGGSTLIPSLGMTFVEAKARHDAVNAEVQRLFEAGDDKVAEQADDECCLIINGMLATMPATIADALAALTIITDETLARLDATDEQEVGPALRAAAAILSTMPAETATRAPHTALDSTVIPALGMT